MRWNDKRDASSDSCGGEKVCAELKKGAGRDDATTFDKSRHVAGVKRNDRGLREWDRRRRLKSHSRVARVPMRRRFRLSVE